MTGAISFLGQIDWKSFLIGEEEWSFLFNIALRTLMMFSVILVSLRMLGKRGIKQLSVFELGVIIGLGSAAGDPMFYRDVGVVACLVVFIVVVLLYNLLKYLTDKNERLGELVEGKPVTIVDHGMLQYKVLEKETLSKAELFTQLRLRNISHLGQIRLAILEPNSEVSVYFLEDKDVIPGLPVIPHQFERHERNISSDGLHACIRCGLTQQLHSGKSVRCPQCGHDEWAKAHNERRLT